MSKEIITKEEFKKMPKGIGENQVLEFFKKNEDKAFKVSYLLKEKEFGYSHSRAYQIIKSLVAMGLIEKKGEYYSLK